MTNLTAGNKAPEFTLPTDQERTVTLADFKGKNLVLYFYPKDDTPGCTKQAKGFRDHIDSFTKNNTHILGVSKDSIEQHQAFKTKYALPFELASDATAKVIETYDCWKEKNMFGKKYMGIERTTFLINEQGTIQKIWKKVKVEGHAQEVLKEIAQR